MPLVIDASVIVPLALDDEDSRYAESVLKQIDDDKSAFVAPIFFDEIQNVLLVAERRGRCQPADSDRFILRVLDVLPLTVVDVEQRLQVMALARKTDLSFYDATYLAAAMETGSAIATSDNRLRIAADSVGVPWFS